VQLDPEISETINLSTNKTEHASIKIRSRLQQTHRNWSALLLRTFTREPDKVLSFYTSPTSRRNEQTTAKVQLEKCSAREVSSKHGRFMRMACRRIRTTVFRHSIAYPTICALGFHALPWHLWSTVKRRAAKLSTDIMPRINLSLCLLRATYRRRGIYAVYTIPRRAMGITSSCFTARQATNW